MSVRETNPLQDPTRRRVLGTSILALAGLGLACSRTGASASTASAAAAAKPRPAPLVNIVEFSNDGKRLRLSKVPKVIKPLEQWRKELSPASFQVARMQGTERPFSGKYNELHDKGVFRCIGCGTALFSSATKFDSGTGWPSFWQPIAAENISAIKDSTLGMVRTEVNCRRCDGHLGHVFDDGPQPTGLRYCMNSVSLNFKGVDA